MNSYRFTLGDARLEARPCGTLWWPEQRLLCVSDLHLCKAERVARRGGTMLPPYETHDTIARLAEEVATLNPAHIVALGDSFDDQSAAQALPDEARAALLTMAAGRVWTWIAGNHDPGPVDLPGHHCRAFEAGPLVFRHIAEPDPQAGEISGHYHPKARLSGRARPCFLIDSRRVILPAFGTYTGGLDCLTPVLRDLMAPRALAVLTGTAALPVPLGTQRRRA